MSGTVFLILRILLTLSLYAFLGIFFIMLWRDLKQHARQLSDRQAPALKLIRLESGNVQQFTKAEINIGRDPACECVIPDKTVSTRHARLIFHHKHWWLEDLGSTNGTFLNDEPVSLAIIITSGDQLRCGQVAFTISIGKAGEGPQTHQN